MTYNIRLTNSNEIITANGFDVLGGALVLYTTTFIPELGSVPVKTIRTYIRAFSPNNWHSIKIIEQKADKE